MSSVHQSLATVVEALNAAMVDAEKCDRGIRLLVLAFVRLHKKLLVPFVSYASKL